MTFKKTHNEYTETSEGLIPHMPWRGLDLPVALVVAMVVEFNDVGRGSRLLYNGSNLPVPVKHNGRYVYALPGGGRLPREL